MIAIIAKSFSSLYNRSRVIIILKYSKGFWSKFSHHSVFHSPQCLYLLYFPYPLSPIPLYVPPQIQSTFCPFLVHISVCCNCYMYSLFAKCNSPLIYLLFIMYINVVFVLCRKHIAFNIWIDSVHILVYDITL